MQRVDGTSSDRGYNVLIPTKIEEVISAQDYDIYDVRKDITYSHIMMSGSTLQKLESEELKTNNMLMSLRF